MWQERIYAKDVYCLENDIQQMRQQLAEKERQIAEMRRGPENKLRDFG
jgi:hypothetical protein